MAALAISAAGLSKRYSIPTRRASDAQFDKGAASNRELRNSSRTWIDAVDDLSFEIGHGEAVGIIGRNGAGKSTLLKLLSRVTRPSRGYADVYGSVGALLEVGTGFHPELTGRENAYLSGAILGMTRRDIAAKFDEIVAFAEVGQFIDTPVKHFSSGMYARLGFAVAAFLKPSILIVDEILAVGDLSFQAKCFAHMRQLSRDGTTVLFVSHNLLGMADFCPRALVMSAGRLVHDGPTSGAIRAYRTILVASSSSSSSPGTATQAGPNHSLRINGETAEGSVEAMPNQRARIDLDVDEPPGTRPSEIELNLVIETLDGRVAMHLRNDMDGTDLMMGPGRSSYSIDIEDLPLAPGTYVLWLRLVALKATTPLMWDTDRLSLIVAGDQRLVTIVQPRYRFTGGWTPR